ncbi:hypothetical protein JTB14_002107 [Gonioctena quinquepunctata]|nr:hypothetical protein JTB14_002107 [Gonioctena quinquepunctata]
MMEAIHAENPGGLEVEALMQFDRDVTAKTEDGAMAHKTEGARKLTNSQLQRLVLLEQLKVARLQQQYFSVKLKDRALSAPEFFHENEKTFEIRNNNTRTFCKSFLLENKLLKIKGNTKTKIV